MRYENEDGRNKSDVGGSSESFLKAPRVTRQVYAETSIIPVTYFIASWANSGSPRVLRALPPATPPLAPRLRRHGLARWFRPLRSADFSRPDRFQFRFIRAYRPLSSSCDFPLSLFLSLSLSHARAREIYEVHE